MMPILYSADEIAFDTNGIGILSDAVDCTVIEILNKISELEMKYPVEGIHLTSIQSRMIIMAKPDPVTEPQPFRIYRIMKYSSKEVLIYAKHIAHDLMGITVAPFSASNIAEALNALKDEAVCNHPFTFSTDQSIAETMSVKVPQQIWKLMGADAGCILDLYGGEYQFDRFNVKLLGQRGLNRGVTIRYGKNLTSLEQDENCANCYTAVHPYWTDKDGNLVQLPERTVQAKGEYDHIKIMPLDLTQEFEEKPSETQLREATEKYIANNKVGVPEVSWKIQFLQLEQTEEYKGTALLERVLLGDTVTVQYTQLGVSATARAVEVRYKPILERYDSITLGHVKAGLADTIISQNKQLKTKPNETQMQLAIKALTSAILGAHGGAVRFLDENGDGVPDTLYIADNPDPNLAIKVWRFNYEGWGASKTGYSGPFVLGASFDTGILAEFVTAGVLYGMTLKAGKIISESGKLSIDLSSDAEAVFNSGISTNGLVIRGDAVGASELFTAKAKYNEGKNSVEISARSTTGEQLLRFVENFITNSDGTASPYGCELDINNRDKSNNVFAQLTETTAAMGVRGSDDDAGPQVRITRNDDSAAVYLMMDGMVQADITVKEDGILLGLPGRSSKYISWKYNDDGTYTLIGRDA